MEKKECQHDITGHMWAEYCSKCGMKYSHSPTAEEDSRMLQSAVVVREVEKITKPWYKFF